MLDLLLACVHHLLILAIFGTLLAELVLRGSGFDRSVLGRISRIDMAYGIFAALNRRWVLTHRIRREGLGLLFAHRVFLGEARHFALIGIVSIKPTIAFMRWRQAEGSAAPSAVRSVRRFLHCELLLFMLLPLFAAAMARGYGAF